MALPRYVIVVQKSEGLQWLIRIVYENPEAPGTKLAHNFYYLRRPPDEMRDLDITRYLTRVQAAALTERSLMETDPEQAMVIDYLRLKGYLGKYETLDDLIKVSS